MEGEPGKKIIRKCMGKYENVWHVTPLLDLPCRLPRRSAVAPLASAKDVPVGDLAAAVGAAAAAVVVVAVAAAVGAVAACAVRPAPFPAAASFLTRSCRRKKQLAVYK